MRYLNIVLFLLMLAFIGVQYNDPDGTLWMVIYAIPAIWSAIAAFRVQWLRNAPGNVLLPMCILLAVAGMVYYWPSTPRWWASDVWYSTETAREGMGIMIVFIVLCIAWVTSKRNTAKPLN